MDRVPDWQGWVKAREVDHFFQLVEIEEIKLDASGPEHKIVVLLRDLCRPRCLIGFEMPTFDDMIAPLPDEELSPLYTVRGAAETYATVMRTNIEEALIFDYKVSGNCSPDGITWVWRL